MRAAVKGGMFPAAAKDPEGFMAAVLARRRNPSGTREQFLSSEISLQISDYRMKDVLYQRPETVTHWDSQISETLTRCWLLRGAASMGAAVSITRLDLTASELRKAASGEKDSAAARRILALALVLDGVDRKTAAETCGMDRQTLRDWVHRYNAAGLAGLRNLKSPGPGSKLTARQQAELAELVDAGPDPAVHGVVRWRRVDLRDELQRRFGVALHERSVGKVLAKLGYRKLSVRPRHPRADEEAQETFKKTSPRPSRRKSPTAPKASRSKSGSRMRPGSASRAR